MDEQRSDPSVSTLRRDYERLAWRWLPFLVFLFLVAITWRRWFMPFQDDGRELLTAELVSEGRKLYRDVGYLYGPLPPYLDGAALRLFRDLDFLIAIRLCVAFLGIEALRRLTRRICNSDAIAGSAVSLVLASCCFRGGGAWPFPYSIAALEGMVGVWWALEYALASVSRATTMFAAVVAGFAGGCKLEMFPAALLAIAPALFLRRPRREAAAAVAVAAILSITAFALPVVLYGADLMRQHGFLLALSLPESWKVLYRDQVFFRGTSPRAFFAGGFLKIWGPSVLLFGIVIAICRVRIGIVCRMTALALLFLGTFFFFLHSPREELAALVPFPLAILLVEGIVALRRRRMPSPRRLTAICVVMVAVMAAARQPFFLRNATYGAFTAPLAIAASLGWLGRRVRARQAFAMFIFALAGFHVFFHLFDRLTEQHFHPVTQFEAPGVRVVLPVAEARFVAAAVTAIERSTPDGAYVACFPEPGFILFATRRQHPFVDTQFYPGSQDMVAEEEMIRRLREAPVTAVLVTNRQLNGFGPGEYGSGILDRFFAVVEHDFRPPVVVGEESAIPMGGRATMSKLYLRR